MDKYNAVYLVSGILLIHKSEIMTLSSILGHLTSTDLLDMPVSSTGPLICPMCKSHNQLGEERAEPLFALNHI